MKLGDDLSVELRAFYEDPAAKQALTNLWLDINGHFCYSKIYSSVLLNS